MCAMESSKEKTQKHYHYDIKMKEKKMNGKARKNCLAWYVISMIEKCRNIFRYKFSTDSVWNKSLKFHVCFIKLLLNLNSLHRIRE